MIRCVITTLHPTHGPHYRKSTKMDRIYLFRRGFLGRQLQWVMLFEVIYDTLKACRVLFFFREGRTRCYDEYLPARKFRTCSIPALCKIKSAITIDPVITCTVSCFADVPFSTFCSKWLRYFCGRTVDVHPLKGNMKLLIGRVEFREGFRLGPYGMRAHTQKSKYNSPQQSFPYGQVVRQVGRFFI